MTSNPNDQLTKYGMLIFAKPRLDVLALARSVVSDTDSGGDWIFAAKALAKELIRIDSIMDDITR